MPGAVAKGSASKTFPERPASLRAGLLFCPDRAGNADAGAAEQTQPTANNKKGSVSGAFMSATFANGNQLPVFAFSCSSLSFLAKSSLFFATKSCNFFWRSSISDCFSGGPSKASLKPASVILIGLG